MAKTVTRSESVLVEKPVLKKDGLQYQVRETYRISEHGNVIPAGFFLKECTDGWYQVFTNTGEKHFFRIGTVLKDKLKIELL